MFVLALMASVFGGCSSCHEEPTIVIRFEPNDMSGVRAASPRPSASPAAAAVVAAPSPAPAHESQKGVTKKKLAVECHKPADCVVMPVECCDCANGGKQRAIAKAQVKAVQAERAQKCKHVMCTMMFSQDPTCGMAADCVAGQCVMVPRKSQKK